MQKNVDWKETDKKYLLYMQKFLDICDNIEDEDLKSRIIKSMLVCDNRLTNLAIDEINKKDEKNKNRLNKML